MSTPVNVHINFSLGGELEDVVKGPFGPFNALHEWIIANAVGFTTTRAVLYFLPILLLYAQAYLLLTPGTRFTRSLLGIAGLSGMWFAWTRLRFTNPWYNAWNHVLSMPYLQFMTKAIEFGLLAGPIRIPYMEGKPRAMAAWDLLINSRMMGLGNVGLDSSPGIPNSKSERGQVERHLRFTVTGWRPKNRALSIARHAAYAGLCYTVFDTIYQTLPLLHPIFRQPYGGNDVLDTFIHSDLRLLPGVLNMPVAPWIVTIVGEAILGVTIWMFFEGFYQMGAVLHLLAGWPVESWDANLFGSMWKADSLIELWGARWHQTFRHMFVIVSSVLMRAFYLPTTRAVLFMLSFFGSGAIHVASEMAMHPVGYPSGLMIFFLLAGVGCALEATLKQFTGHRVSGVLGQVWTWGYMAVIGKWVTWGWLAAGYGGCWVTPGGGPGDYIAHLLVKYVIAQGPQ